MNHTSASWNYLNENKRFKRSRSTGKLTKPIRKLSSVKPYPVYIKIRHFCSAKWVGTLSETGCAGQKKTSTSCLSNVMVFACKRWFNFPIVNFHLYVVIFQQHLHMKYISLSWSDVLEVVVPIEIYLIDGSYWTKGSYWLSWNHHFESFTVATMTCLTIAEYLFHKCFVCCNHNPVFIHDL